MTFLDNDINTEQASPENDQLIHFMLKAVEARVSEMKDKVSVSKEMLPLGVDTDLTVELKKLVANPLSHLFGMKKEMDGAISGLIKLVAKEFFKLHHNKVNRVFVTDTGRNSELHLSIILHENTNEDRSLMYNFLSEYKSTQLWNDFPVYFQIVPPQLEEKVISQEILFEK